MSFPKYPEYKDSGVEWFGDVPCDWRVQRLKQVVNPSRPITYGIVQAGENVPNGIPYIRPADMADESGVKTEDALLRTSQEIASAYRRSSISAGDIVCSIGPSFGKLMMVPLSLEGANLTQGTARVAVANEHVPRFIFWVLRSVESYQQWESSVGGATFRALNLGPLAETFLCVPSWAEQTQIAHFLDHETARIDALIEEQQRLIELLKEKRQAVISHAVTKGLDPTVSMKDSGVEWLGEVPAHWRVCKLSFRYSVELGKMLDEKRNTGANPVPYLRNQDVQWGTVNIDELPLMDIEPAEYGRYTVRLGDLLVCEGGDVGRAAIWRHIDRTIGYQKALHRLRPESLKHDTAEFFFYTLMAAKSLGVFEESDTKATISHLPAEKFRQYRFAFPPLEEQQNIAAVMGEILERSNETISYAERTITLLQERRSALISAAVTGKIDVRGWQPPASAQAPELAVAEAV